MVRVLVSLALALLQGWPEPGQVVKFIDPFSDFAAVHTFAWEKGLEVFDRETHKMIVAAVEAELTARGLRRVALRDAHVVVRYDALATQSVDLDELARQTHSGVNLPPPTKTLGSLALAMHKSPTHELMWRAHAREFVDLTRNVRNASIRKIVARVFETCPRPATP